MPFIYIWYKKLQYSRLRRLNGLEKDALLQSAPTTQRNRHPDIFNELKHRFKDKPIRILSFGCSTGEECKSLSEYMPLAHIVGVDVNKQSIAKAIGAYKSEKVSFYHSQSDALGRLGEFDLILAVSVLCRYPESDLVNDSAALFPFKLFNKTLEHLDQILKPNGLFFIRSSNYRLMDASISHKYSVEKFLGQRDAELFPKFDSNHKRLVGYLEMDELFAKNP